MKIKIGDKTFDVVSVSVRNDLLLIQTSDTIDHRDVLSLLLNNDSIVYMDDESNVVQTFAGKFKLNSTEISNGFVYYRIHLPSDAEKAIQKVDKMESNLASQLVPLSIVFVQMSQDGILDDITISEHPDLFPEWTENWTGKAGTILREGDTLYRSIHDITTTAQNAKPSETPSMWTIVADPTEEYPMWVQPIGAHDAYSIGDKVSHNDEKWISIVDGNVWKPGVYGWTEVTEQ